MVLANLINGSVVMMDPSVAGRYARLSRIEFEARWHDWSDDGSTKEYHTAILLKGKNKAELSIPYDIR